LSYFKRTGTHSFEATDHVSGAWEAGTQHIAPALGLLAHAVETDRDRRRTDPLTIGRLSYDILGTIPVDTVEIRVGVIRPGRTIELVEAVLSHDGRDAVRLRAWLMQPQDTTAVAGTTLRPIAPPETMTPWDASTLWPGGFIASADVRRQRVEPGRASFWVRTAVPLVEDEDVSALASAAGLFDIANGMTVRAHPRDVVYPNIDLTAHLFGTPRGKWVGFDTAVSFGPNGIGLTSSVLHDVDGPFGTLAQALIVRPAELPPRP
jgi:hypothetical protein